MYINCSTSSFTRRINFSFFIFQLEEYVGPSFVYQMFAPCLIPSKDNNFRNRQKKYKTPKGQD